jgi:transposase
VTVAESDSPPTREQELEALVRRMQGELAATTEKLAAATGKIASITSERDNLRRAYRQLMEQFELLKRRIFIAKAERVDATQLELEFEKTKKKLDALAQQLGGNAAEAAAWDGSDDPETPGSRPSGKPPARAKTSGKGRRNLADRDDLPQRRIEIRDPESEKSGGTCIGWEESYKLGYQRPQAVRVVLARAKYKMPVAHADASSRPDDATVSEQDGARVTIVTAPLPPLLIRRGLLAPSMLAHVLVQKFRFGMPFFRQEEQLEADGIELDRGTMARSTEDIGACFGAIVQACVDDARKHAFCLCTDATGVAIRPEPLPDGRRQPCRKGHFFVVLADKKHIFFEFQPKHTSAAVCEMFRGFSGYIQADAHTIYDALFRGDAVEDGADPPIEVACWSHARRRLWEAAVSGFAVGKEGLLRVRKLYELDQAWSKLPPSARLEKRRTVLAPFVDEFFTWVHAQNDLSSQVRGLISKALGYAIRQERALRRFLDDGRLRMDNNSSENALRVVATGRKSWLFFGSDDHAQAAANIYSLIASCKLHSIDPERYFAELIHVMPYWPRDRYLELAPAYWAQTRTRLDPVELEAELGFVTVPPVLVDTAQQASAG